MTKLKALCPKCTEDRKIKEIHICGGPKGAVVTVTLDCGHHFHLSLEGKLVAD